MRVLVCSAHPDDETLGAGGTILRHTLAGDEVAWVVFTQPIGMDWTREYAKTARAQALEAARRLGINDACIEFLGQPAAGLDTVSQAELNRRLTSIIGAYVPEVVYTPWAGDVHHDHRSVAEAVMVATRPQPGHPVKRVLAYETCSSSEWGSDPFPANVYVDVADTLDAKLHALAAYQSEAKVPPHPRSPEGVRARAVLRGFEVGLHAAEAFHLIRDIS